MKKLYHLLVYLKIYDLQEMLSKLHRLDFEGGKVIKYRQFTDDEKKEFIKEFDPATKVRITEVSIPANSREEAAREIISAAQQFGTTVVKIEDIDGDNWYA